jgi:hypothetical protein
MLIDEHNPLPERELLIRPLLDCFIEGGARQEHRSRGGDNPADMQCVLVPMSCKFGFSISRKSESTRR